jgi:surface antigen
VGGTPRSHTFLGVAVLGLLCFSGSAQALTLSGTHSVHAGGVARLQATLNQPVNGCELALGRPASVLSQVEPQHEHVQWSWRVPVRTRSSAWRLLVVCDSQQASFTMRVDGQRRGLPKHPRLTVRTVQFGASLSDTPPPAAPPPPPAPSCTNPWTCPPVNAPQLPPADQVFVLAVGECGDWAGYKRPDIWYNQAANDSPWNGASTWGEHASAEGLVVNSTPQVGDIAVWPVSFSPPYGHVAYVESVGQNEIMVSEMNAPFDPVVLQTPDGYTYYERTESLTELAEQGVQFIQQP